MSCRTIIVGALLALTCGGRCLAATAKPSVIEVDATDAARRLFHARLVLPVESGPVTLNYPKWLPGWHTPDGPINSVVGLKLSAGGRPVPWRRDDIDMFAFHADVPAGVNELEVKLDFIAPVVEAEGITGKLTTAATVNVAIVSWESMLLYPKGGKPDELMYRASVRLPKDWRSATSLPPDGAAEGQVVAFKPVTLTTLIDSPLIAGRHFRRVSLGEAGGAEHEIDVVADTATALEMTPEYFTGCRSLLAETHALFGGARHYGAYRFLLTLSDPLHIGAVEHYECTDVRAKERILIDDDMRLAFAEWLPHEFVHSWNGKYRRPAGLATADYQEPMKGELLWVYEGLTSYLEKVLSARSGLMTDEQVRDDLAEVAARFEHRPGRAWRPLADTAVAAQLTYTSATEWASLRRGTDFYEEGALIWLEADLLIREQTEGRRSLDDFCKAFFGGGNGRPAVKPYDLNDVVAALDSVSHSDWKQFFAERVYAAMPTARFAGIERSGWRVAYREEIGPVQKSWEAVNKNVGLLFSIGLDIGEEGRVTDVVPGSPADKAGFAPAQKILGVEGRKYSEDRVRSAVKRSKNSAEPLEFIVQTDDEFMKVLRVDYHDGARYPTLERDESKTDRLGEVFKPRTTHPATAPAPAEK